MLSASDLSSILNSAMRRHAQSSHGQSSLIPFLCEELVRHLHLSSAAVWHVDAVQEPRILWEHNAANWAPHTSLEKLRAVPAGEVTRAQPFADQASSGSRFAFSAASLDGRTKVAIGLETADGLLEDADVLQSADLIADIRRREMLGTLSDHLRRSTNLLALISALQATADRQELFHRFCTDAAVVIGVDRISLLSRSMSGSWQVVACTGVDNISSRSTEVRHICTLVKSAEQGGLARADSGNRISSVFPLTISNTWKQAEYACIFESSADDPRVDEQITKLLIDQLSMALALQNERIKQQKSQNHRLRRRVLVWGGSLALACGFSVFLFTQTEFQIRAKGEVLPVHRQRIFSPEQGVISEVFAEHGQHVTAGTVLCRVYSDDLEVRREKMREDLVSAQARASALKTIAVRPSPAGERELPLSVEQAELEQKIASLQTQVQLIDKQIAAMSVVAPFDGQVIHERLREELLGRPVQQGQYLFQFIDPHGEWELLLRIPEREIRHVLDAQLETADGCPVTFVMETSPTIEHRTLLRDVSNTTDLDSTGGLSTLARADLDRNDVQDVRLGAGVLARIGCGKRTWFYIFTRGISEFWARHSPF